MKMNILARGRVSFAFREEVDPQQEAPGNKIRNTTESLAKSLVL